MVLKEHHEKKLMLHTQGLYLSKLLPYLYKAQFMSWKKLPGSKRPVKVILFAKNDLNLFSSGSKKMMINKFKVIEFKKKSWADILLSLVTLKINNFKLLIYLKQL